MKIVLFFIFLATSMNSYGQFKADSTYKPLDVAILLYDGVELLDFAGPGEVFQQANFNGKDAFNVYTCGINSNKIISQSFLNITTQYIIDDCQIPDILIIPGGNNLALVNNDKLIAWISKVNEKAKFVLSVCNGLNLLAKTGDLDGMTATSHYGAIENLIKNYPKISIVTGKRFVDNGRIITTEGVSAGIDGSLYLLSKIFNMEVANNVAKIMMYNWNPETLDYLVIQNKDTIFEKRISAFTWMPDGSAIILNIIKVDKTENNPPITKKFKFSIALETVELLPIDGGGLAVSPDGKSVAYIKHVNGNDQIYLYNFSQKEDKLLVNDTFKKYAVSWSSDGNSLVYNIQIDKGENAKVEICTYNIQKNEVNQITKNSTFKCYAPNWNTKTDKIVYTSEYGNKRDQIYLTDKNGSLHTNLTNDSTTHNYSPYWIDENTIMYIQSPKNLMTMKIDGSQKQFLNGMNTTQFKYNSATNNIIYLDDNENLIIVDFKSKSKKILIHQNRLNALFSESNFEK